MQQHNNEQLEQMVSAIKGNEETSGLLAQLAGILNVPEREIVRRLYD